MNKSAGFSLIELVIVIVVLGLLAVAALPKFLHVTDRAKQASIEAVAGGFATAVLSARAQWEAKARPRSMADNPNSNYVDYDGSYFQLSSSKFKDGTQTKLRDGYPMAYFGDDHAPQKQESPTRITNTDVCIELFRHLLQNPPSINADSSAKSVKYLASVEGDTVCRYVQLANSHSDAAHYFEYDASKGNVSITVK
ncbi:type II secretion system protein [Vibrio gallicus]|uniref:type II secretion system protein n=1 Tax=Vibrio gallicus TaxID=190897 RepID=UPI0021C4700B|nr:type II secretion system protein [Vibrio gallicus]